MDDVKAFEKTPTADEWVWVKRPKQRCLLPGGKLIRRETGVGGCPALELSARAKLKGELL